MKLNGIKICDILSGIFDDLEDMVSEGFLESIENFKDDVSYFATPKYFRNRHFHSGLPQDLEVVCGSGLVVLKHSTEILNRSQNIDWNHQTILDSLDWIAKK